MQITEYTIHRKTKSEHEQFILIPIGDIHLGSAGCDQAKLKETIKFIETNSHAYWIGMGDYIEAINPSDPRFDPYSIDPSYNIKDLSSLITTQVEDIKAYFRPIKDKCICLLTGNHEEKVRTRYYRDVTLEMANEFNVKYIGYTGFIRMRFKNPTGNGRRVFDIYAEHGYGGGRTSGPKVNKLESLARKFDVDLILSAHVHQKVIAPPIIRISVDHRNQKLVARKTHAITTGSYKKAFVLNADSYEEKFGYGPSDLGSIKIRLYPRYRLEKEIIIEMN